MARFVIKLTDEERVSLQRRRARDEEMRSLSPIRILVQRIQLTTFTRL